MNLKEPSYIVLMLFTKDSHEIRGGEWHFKNHGFSQILPVSCLTF